MKPLSRPGILAAEFRALMAGFPSGVAIVTAISPDGTPWGMTCSSVCSVSITPPTLLVCVRDGSPTLAAMLGQGTFAVNLLHDNARPTSELFASGRPDRFTRVSWHIGPAGGGPHLPDDSHAVADCRVSMTQPVGDHIVVFGEVFHVSHTPSRRMPLVYGLRRYVSWPAS
jgi:flavin reductase (DIM6/NTAB) family NADH-FMN oxidoreductase RutF